jgi:hypothetical protein
VTVNHAPQGYAGSNPAPSTDIRSRSASTPPECTWLGYGILADMANAEASFILTPEMVAVLAQRGWKDPDTLQTLCDLAALGKPLHVEVVERLGGIDRVRDLGTAARANCERV